MVFSQRRSHASQKRLAVTDVTQILSAIQAGEPQASDRLFAAVYEELRRMAAQKMSHESPDHTLQGTALVHEAYLRLVGARGGQQWDSRGHFFSAAAEAMRRILVDHARRRDSQKRGGQRQKMELQDGDAAASSHLDDVLALDEALATLAGDDPDAAAVAKLRLFAGLSIDESAAALGCSRATAYRQWSYARAWLRAKMRGD